MGVIGPPEAYGMNVLATAFAAPWTRFVGHRLAEVSVHQFVTDVAAYLRRMIGPGSA
jgi:hypothetical protein